MAFIASRYIFTFRTASRQLPPTPKSTFSPQLAMLRRSSKTRASPPPILVLGSCDVRGPDSSTTYFEDVDFFPDSPVITSWSNEHEENSYHPYDCLEIMRQGVGHSLWIAKCQLIGPTGIPAGNVLDIGTGTGDWAIDATAVLRQRKIIGIDLNDFKRMAETSCSCPWTDAFSCNCRLTNPPTFETRNCELDLNVPDQSVALVNLRDSYLWVRNTKGLIDRITRVLCPGGWVQNFELRICEWHSNKPTFNRWCNHVVNYARSLGIQLSSDLDVRSILEAHGFQEYRTFQQECHTYPSVGRNDRLLLFVKLTIKTSHRTLLDGGFGDREAVSSFLRDVM